MKHLSVNTISTRKNEKKLVKQKEEVSITVPVKAEEEAIQEKEKLLNTKLFGLFSPVKYKVISTRKVYVPFELLVFSYEVSFGKKKNRFLPSRNENTGIVYNIKENHAFYFDLREPLDMEKASYTHLDGELLADGCQKEEIVEKSLFVLKQKVLRRVYPNAKDIKIVRKIRFYRPACEMIVEARGREFIKYAYIDGYGSSNEHVSGLKTRLRN